VLAVQVAVLAEAEVVVQVDQLALLEVVCLVLAVLVETVMAAAVQQDGVVVLEVLVQ
jgi:hypothetical protein